MFSVVPEENIKGEINALQNLVKPPKYTIQTTFPFNDLSDTQFEILIYLIAQKKAQNQLLSIKYDSCGLLASAGDKGRDVILKRNGICVGILQCKKYKTNLDRKNVLREILKFLIYYLEDKSLIPDFKEFHYSIAASTGFSKGATGLLDNFGIEVAKESEIDKMAKEIIQEYKTIKNTYEAISEELKDSLSKLHVDKITPHDITAAITDKPDLIKMFFTVDSVIDKEAFQDIISGGTLDVPRFLENYSKGVISNYSRINFFGLALPKKPREVELYSLFVHPTLRRQTSAAYDFHLNTTNLDLREHFFEDIYMTNEITQPFEFFDIIKTDIKSEIEDAIIFADRWPEKYFEQYNNVSFGSKIRKEQNFEFKDIFNGERNLVILGDAGAGKSSLIKYTICKLVEGDKTVFSSQGIYNRIPVRIELSKYNEYKKTANEGFVSYINALLETDHQLNFINKHSVAKLLETYNSLIFFDGLDEIIDPQERIKVRNEIESFCNNHQKVRAIVTCRPEAYEEVHFQEKDFDVYEINLFNDEQIGKFVNKWYAIEEGDAEKRENEITSCLNELLHVEDELKRNPLLLSLILIIYRNALEFPATKLDVYESCTNTLVEVRDVKEKKLKFALKISNKIALFSAVAFWQYEQLSSKQKKNLNHHDVIAFLKKYLIEKKEFDDEYIAEQASIEFLDFARLRSIYVDNGFTHKTFHEYFTAYYIFANYHAKGRFKERDELIENKISDPAWYIVLELLICKIDKDQPDFDVMDNILHYQLKSNILNTTAFFIQIIKYLRNISAGMKSLLISNALEICIGVISSRDINIIKTINSHLLALSEIPEFVSLMSKKLTEMISKITSIPIRTKYMIFILENAIQHPKFAQFLPRDDFESSLNEDPYLFLLAYYPEFSDWQAYVKRLKEFIRKFKLRMAIEQFRARYVYNIFAGSNRFHWLLTPLFSSPEFGSFLKRYQTFTNIGFSLQNIRKAIHKDTGTIDLTIDDLMSFHEKTNHSGIKVILEDALKKYYKLSYVPEKEKIPYFEKKYNPRRKFQISR